MVNLKASKVIFMKTAIALSASALILAGCGKGEDKSAAAPSDSIEVKIGHVAPLTGPHCSFG